MTKLVITKESALAAFDNNCAALARFLKIKPQAVQQWADGEPIPALRQYQLRESLPEAFGNPAPKRSKAGA